MWSDAHEGIRATVGKLPPPPNAQCVAYAGKSERRAVSASIAISFAHNDREPARNVSPSDGPMLMPST